MALNGNDLGDALMTAVTGAGAAGDRQAIFRAMGNTIVNYIKSNAQVLVASVSGVTPGPGASGTGTGTIL